MKKLSNLLAAGAVAVAIFLGSSAKAQTIVPNQWRFGVGAEGGITTGDATKFSNLELGGTARIQYGFSNHLALTVTSGYYNFFGKSEPGVNTKFQSEGMVPIKAGVKYFFTQNLYLAGEAGAGVVTKQFKAQGVDDSDISGHNTKLLLSPGVGWASKHWDVGVRYENYSGQDFSFGMVALRLAYGFGI